MARSFYLRLRTYADKIAVGDLWLIAVEGPVEFACLHGEWTPDNARDLAKALKLELREEKSAFSRRENWFTPEAHCKTSPRDKPAASDPRDAIESERDWI